MKKFISIICLVLLCCVVLPVTVSAIDVDIYSEPASEHITTAYIDTEPPEVTIAGYGGEYEKIFLERLRLNWTENGMVDYYEYKELYYYYGDNTEHDEETTADYVLVYAARPISSPATDAKAIGEYVIITDHIYNPYAIALYIYVSSEDRIYTLEEAYDANIEGLDNAFDNKLFKETVISTALIGDTDSNNVVNIKDATLIQKQLASIETINNDWIPYLTYKAGEPKYLSDFDRDGERTIKDATAIQKYIAGLEY